MFEGLHNLVFLNIMGNDNPFDSNQTYPNDIWANLPSLTNIQLDAIDGQPLPAGFKKLLNLSSLKIRCDHFSLILGKLYNTTFNSLSGLSLSILNH